MSAKNVLSCVGSCLLLLAASACSDKGTENSEPVTSDDAPDASTETDSADTEVDTAQSDTDTLDTESETIEDWGEAPGMKTELAGVNLSGAEFGADVLPGVYDVNYTYPRTTSLAYFIAKGMNVFRVPFMWERLQRELFGDFHEKEQERLTTLVQGITDKGATAILDPHNYARYDGEIVGEGVEILAFQDFWSKLATLFGDNERVVFGLMNEPHDMDTALWFEAAVAATAAVREAGADNLILVPGNRWTGAHSWSSASGDISNAEAFGSFEDPADNFAVEVHQYLDGNSSGTGSTCVSENVGVERLLAFTEWARQTGVRAFLGEFGTPSNSTCLHAVDNMLSYIGDNADVWIGWTWWSAGPWWGDYPMSVEPDNGNDKPQMFVLSRHLN